MQVNGTKRLAHMGRAFPSVDHSVPAGCVKSSVAVSLLSRSQTNKLPLLLFTFLVTHVDTKCAIAAGVVLLGGPHSTLVNLALHIKSCKKIIPGRYSIAPKAQRQLAIASRC